MKIIEVRNKTQGKFRNNDLTFTKLLRIKFKQIMNKILESSDEIVIKGNAKEISRGE